MSTRKSRSKPKRKFTTAATTAAATSLNEHERRVLRKRVRISYELDNDENRDQMYQSPSSVTPRKQRRISNNIRNDQHPSPCSGTGYTCPECGIGFKNADILTRHQANHSKTSKKFCKDCKKYLRFKGTLENHKRFHNGKGGYQCSKCDSIFQRKYNLDRHDRNVHTNNRVYCTVCKMNVRSERRLMIHETFHEGRGGFQCSECKQIFSEKYNLVRHIQSVHEGIKRVRIRRTREI